MDDVLFPLQNLDGSKMDRKCPARPPEIRRFSPKFTHRLWINFSAK
jgi:hypothetical protein